MKKIALIGAAAAALLSSPLFAQPERGQPGPRAEVSRAEVEARVRDNFARLDANRDGFVTQDETDTFRQSRRAERQERRGDRREAVFARLDANRDGSISRDEFFNGRNLAERGGPRGLRAGRPGERFGGRGPGMARRGGPAPGMMFARLDADHDGRVSLAEATSARLRLFDRADLNRDGRVTPEERQTLRAERRDGRRS